MRWLKLKIEARTTLILTFILTFSILISDFNPLVCLLALIPTFIAIRNILKISTYFPVFLLLLLSLKIDFKLIFGIFSLITVGLALVSRLSLREFFNSLLFFKIPYTFAFIIIVAFSFLKILLRDLKNIYEIKRHEIKSKFMLVSEIMKSLSSVAILRAIVISELLYSRGYLISEPTPEYEKLKLRDYFFLFYSVFVLFLVLSIC